MTINHIDITTLDGNIKPYNCIVLDLDGTLIHSCENNLGDGEEIVFVDVYGKRSNIWVHKRPGFDIFLKKCFEVATVGVWSMGQPGYVEAMVNLFPQRPKFVYNWCDCDRTSGAIFKKLDNIPYSGSIVMIDDKVDILEETERVDTIIIPEWNPDQKNDNILFHLISSYF